MDRTLTSEEASLFAQFMQANELGVRLEIVRGLPMWEAHPVLKHQRAIDRIRASIQPGGAASGGQCHCIHVSGVYVRFPDGSFKRPDVAILCREPDDEEEAVMPVPEAVIEVISKGFEAKDLEIGPHFYLSQGVQDVVVFDPYTLLVLYVRRDAVARHVAPIAIELRCGCRCVV